MKCFNLKQKLNGLLIFLTQVQLCFSAISTDSVDAIRLFEGVRRTDYLLLTGQAYSRLTCMRRCAADFRCLSFFYNTNSYLCQLHSVIFGDMNQAVSETNTQYYIVGDKARCPIHIRHYVHIRGLDTCHRIMLGPGTDWTGANGVCNAQSMHMSKFSSKKEYSLIENILMASDTYRKHFYVGGSRINDAKEWRWTDGSPMDFSELDNVWMPGEPQGHACAYMTVKENRYQWNDFGCEFWPRVLCQKDI